MALPRPPELSSIDFLGLATETEQISEGKKIARAWFLFARDVLSATPPDPVDAKFALDALEKAKEELSGLIATGNDTAAVDIEFRLSNLSKTFESKLKEILEAARSAAVVPVDAAPSTGEISALFTNPIEQQTIENIFFPVTPLSDELFSKLKKLKSSIDGYAVIPRSEQRATNILTVAQKIITQAFQYADKTRDVSKSWELLLDEMTVKGVNPDAHGEFAKPIEDGRLKDLYNWFNEKKAPKIGESAQDQLRRIEKVMGWKLQLAMDENTGEGQVPSCTRKDLFPVMSARGIERDELLLYTTYHPAYGDSMRKMLKHLVWLIAQRPDSDMNYKSLILLNGRAKMRNYVETVFKPQLLGVGSAPPRISGLPPTVTDPNLSVSSLFDKSSPKGIARYNKLSPEEKVKFDTLTTSEKEKQVDDLLQRTLTVFYLFDLLTVSFAELQKKTETRGHDKSKAGVAVTDVDRVLISRPDVALVHRTQRYAADSDWSAWWLVVQKNIPPDYGRISEAVNPVTKAEEEKKMHNALVETQKKLIFYLESYFDTDGFTGANGIPPSSLFEPLFPDMMSYLTLSEDGDFLLLGDEVIEEDGGELKISNLSTKRSSRTGDLPSASKINTKDNYLVAEQGWQKFLELTLGQMPPTIKEEQILTKADGFDTGMIDGIIGSAAGLAKLFAGNHMKKALVPLFALYIGNIFMRYDDIGKKRINTFDEMIVKLKSSALPGGGLGSFPKEIDRLVQILSDGNDGKKMGRMLLFNRENREAQRQKYLDIIWDEKKKSKPKVTAIGASTISAITNAFDPQSRAEQEEYIKMMRGETVPAPGVTRRGNLMRKEEKGA